MLHSGEFSLRDYAEMLVRRRWLILGFALVGLLIGLVPASLADSMYSGTATIRIRASDYGSPFEDSTEDVNVQVRNLVTDQEVIQSEETRALVIERMGDSAEPFEDVSATIVPYSELIEISVTAPSAATAAEVANAYADVYVDMVRESSVEALELQASELRGRARDDSSRQAAIEQQLLSPELPAPERSSLEQERATLASQIASYTTRADQLEVEIALRQQVSSVVSRAQIDYDPIGATPFSQGVIGAVLGFLSGLCVAVVKELLDDRISSPSALESLDPDLRILAAVPHADTDLDRPDSETPRPVREAIRYLRTGLRVNSIDHPFSSVLISSSLSKEGKTTTAVHLAQSMARDGVKVVLVDADTRMPSIHERLGLDNDIGLSSILSGDVSFSEVVQYVNPSMAVVTAGPPTEDASELLRGFQFEQMVRRLSDQADLVIIDTPPVLPVADALEVSRVVDAALLVARVDRIRRRDVQAAIKRFKDARVRLLGFVANDFSSGSSEYGRYGYGGYGYGGYGDEQTERLDEDEPGAAEKSQPESSDALA